LDYRGIGSLVKRLVHPRTTGSHNLGVSIVFMAPGEEVIVHDHLYEEAYFVLSGEGVMTLDDEKIQLEKNLSVYVPPNSRHGQKNTGDMPLVILCSLTPPPGVW
jgi:mannose-6-phosphate isomerase-like protein (cupin superfamily)